jgi:pimeloyl-ACP methyl ester carboxylesterase
MLVARALRSGARGAPSRYARAPLFTAARTTEAEVQLQLPALARFAEPDKQLLLPPTSDPPPQKAVLDNGHAITFTDAGPRDAAVLVAVHGAPGSVFDWRYFSGVEARLRLLRFDLPGHATTPQAAAGGFHVSHMAAALWEATDVVLGGKPSLTGAEAAVPATGANGTAGDRGVYIVCHSLGTDVAMEMAAERPGSVRGVALIAPVGLRPHKALRPFWVVRALSAALDVPVLRWVMPTIMWRLYIHVLRFPRRTTVEEVVWCQRRVGVRDFARLASNVAAVRAAGIPVFVAHSADDHLVEQAVSGELAVAAGANYVVDYASGGHLLLKHQAASLSQHLQDWVARCEEARERGGRQRTL